VARFFGIGANVFQRTSAGALFVSGSKTVISVEKGGRALFLI
jgi:hypothetical protein